MLRSTCLTIFEEIYRVVSIEKKQINFGTIFLIFKLKYLNNYLIKIVKNFFILILKLYRIKIKKKLLNLIR